MRLSIQRLRWVLITGALLLVVVLVGYIGYGRYKKLRAYQGILAKYGVSVTHDTFGYTYSQSDKGKKIFTLHAARATRLGDGKYALHDAELTLFGRDDGRTDTVQSSEIEYDEKEGLARARGEVMMELEVPQATGKENADQVIHVKTSGLVYVRKLGVAATDQVVEFQYGDLQGTSRGAEFNTGQSTLHLLADVKADGELHDQPVHLAAERADIDRNENVATLMKPVVNSGGRRGTADAAVLDLRKDGSIRRGQALGNVTMSSGTQQITAAKMDATLSARSVPETAKLLGGVVLVDTDKMRPVHGSANEVEALFDAKGAAKTVTATGAAKVLIVDYRANARGLTRSMEGTKIMGMFVPVEGKTTVRLSEVHAVGAARVRGESVGVAKGGTAQKPVEELKTTQMAADDLRVLFAEGSKGTVRPERVFGVGHTMLEQDAAMGEQQTSAGDSLEAVFAQAAAKDSLLLVFATQAGHVVIHSRAATKAGTNEAGAVSMATAERGDFDGASQRLTLNGRVHVEGDGASLYAPAVTLDQRTQDVEAHGGVQATLENAKTAVDADVAVTHVLASDAHFSHAARVAIFSGTDAEPAKMWQGASQVQAATLLFDDGHRTFSARMVAPGAVVHAVFAGKPSTAAAAHSHAASVVLVESPKMDYNDVQREAVFTGGAKIDGTMGEVRGQRAVVLMMPTASATAGNVAAGRANAGKTVAVAARPNPFGGSNSGTIDRVVVSGDVVLDQPGRRGRGDQILYTAATDNYVLTGTPGKPAKIEDATQGNVSGATLLFGDAGSTIVVAGEPGGKKHGTRVHTETEVRQ